MYPRQGGQIAVLGGRPTVLGGFHEYDQYPDMVEQFDIDSGRIRIKIKILSLLVLIINQC